jgi:hypothetical protein
MFQSANGRRSICFSAADWNLGMFHFTGEDPNPAVRRFVSPAQPLIGT